MNVLDAAYCTGRDYPGGAEALALRLGKPNLSDELNPNRPAAKLGLQTALDMQQMSGDYRILYALASELRHYPPIPMPAECDEAAPCMRTLGAVAAEFGALLQEVTTDLADETVTNTELARAQRAWADVVAAGQQLMQQMAALNAHNRRREPGASSAGGAA